MSRPRAPGLVRGFLVGGKERDFSQVGLGSGRVRYVSSKGGLGRAGQGMVWEDRSGFPWERFTTMLASYYHGWYTRR